MAKIITEFLDLAFSVYICQDGNAQEWSLELTGLCCFLTSKFKAECLCSHDSNTRPKGLQMAVETNGFLPNLNQDTLQLAQCRGQSTGQNWVPQTVDIKHLGQPVD